VPVKTGDGSGTGRRLYMDTVVAGSSYDYQVIANRPSPAIAVPAARSGFVAPANGNNLKFVGRTDNLGITGGSNAPSDANDGSFGLPWASIGKAGEDLLPGQTVLVRGGTYTNLFADMVIVKAQGTNKDTIVTFKAYPGEVPTLAMKLGENRNGFFIAQKSWLTIDGFTIIGTASEIDPNAANSHTAEFLSPYQGAPVAANGAPFQTVANSGVGINVVGSETATTPTSHHITIINNTIYDQLQGGIAVNFADYVTIENNIVYNSSNYSTFAGSGISIFESKSYDANLNVYRNVIRNNLVYDNRNEVNCDCGNRFTNITDGNGIILDRLDNFNYPGKTLIANNIVYGNGGRGIHLPLSSNVDVIYNTVGDNGQTGGNKGEIAVQGGKNVNIYNNILFSPRKAVATVIIGKFGSAESANVSFLGNIYTRPDNTTTGFTFSSTGTVTSFDLTKNTLLITSDLSSLKLTPAAPNTTVTTTSVGPVLSNWRYQLQTGSPAINNGFNTSQAPTQIPSLAVPLFDFYYAPRPRGVPSGGDATTFRDVGAVESF
jgi:parallel beta-helix repeat protein